jgi:hypothetical protein
LKDKIKEVIGHSFTVHHGVALVSRQPHYISPLIESTTKQGNSIIVKQATAGANKECIAKKKENVSGNRFV